MGHKLNNVKCLTQVMGILNATPDSFYEGARHMAIDLALKRAHQMKEEGADWIDIGGESTRPFADDVLLQEELARVIPLFEALQGFPLPLSIDTKKAPVAKRALELGASMINDVSGFCDETMVEAALEFPHADLCLVHSQKGPKEMQIAPSYPLGVVDEICRFFEERVAHLVKRGVAEKRLILDPGIGFGKTVAHNLEILHNLQRFKSIGFRLLVGISRKSFMTRALGIPTHELLLPTVALNRQCAIDRVDIIRVHDVLEHRKVVDRLNG